MFDNIKTDLSLSLLIGKRNNQTADQDDQMTADKEGERNRIGSYESAEDVDARLLSECSFDSHEVVGSHNEKDPLLCLNSPLSYKRLKVNKTNDSGCIIIFL